jgi:arsenate reductase
MAEGFVRHFFKDKAEVYSAGLEPKGVHPMAVKVMGEIGIDISHHTSNHLSEYASMTFDFVITVCSNAAERCPTFSSATNRLHWPFDDPAAIQGTKWEIIDGFRRIRDQIGDKVKAWHKQLSA